METLQRTANRGSISTGYDVDNSLLLEGSDSGKNFNHQQMSPGSGDQWSAQSNAGTNSKTATISMWIKRSKLSPSSGDGQHMRLVQFQTGGNATALYLTNDKINMYDDVTSSYLVSNRVLRDTSAWMHIVLAMDSTQATASNRVKIYVNGVQETSWATEDYGNQNSDLAMFSTTNVTFYLGCTGSNNGQYTFNGYISEFHFVDGSQKTASDFGEYDEDSGIWKPKAYSGTHGILGAYYNFEDTSNNKIHDESGNDNYINNRGDGFEGGIATDTPTNNFATWNVLANNAGIFTYTEGATKWKPTSGNWASTTASLGFTKGKWYAEFKAASNVTNVMVGVQELSGNYVGGYSGQFANSTSEGYGYYNASGNVYNNGANSSYGTSFPVSVLVGVALDFKDDGTALMYISKDNVWQNSADPANGTGGYSLNSGNAVEGFFSFAGSLYQNNDFLQANFGGYTVNTISSAATDANGYGNFEYAPPSGYYALCTKNLAEYG